MSERVSERVSDELLGKEIIMEEDVNERKKRRAKKLWWSGVLYTRGKCRGQD